MNDFIDWDDRVKKGNDTPHSYVYPSTLSLSFPKDVNAILQIEKTDKMSH
ncbi:MAG: hypothetical protein H0W19_03870 [Nitrosopumilus sp.]|nr:hypothetical protein [Nitrosopumilus sp.]